MLQPPFSGALFVLLRNSQFDLRFQVKVLAKDWVGQEQSECQSTCDFHI